MSLPVRKPAPEEEDLSAFWLITYSDMTTLLLTFFLLIYAFTMLGEGSQEELLDSLNLVQKGGEVEKFEEPLKKLEETAQEIAAMMGKDSTQTGDQPWVNATESEVTIGLPSDVTFASGKADLKEQGEKHLRAAAKRLATVKTPIRIEGHTDDVPIRGGRYPTNWHLSVARAQSVLRIFLDEGRSPRTLEVIGYADTRPLVSNETVEGRRANRRIELKLIRTGQKAPASKAGDSPPSGATPGETGAGDAAPAGAAPATETSAG